MPLLTPHTSIASGANVTSAQYNTPFTAIWNLINGGGTAAGIDFNNVSATANIPFSNIVPSTTTNNYTLPGSLSAVGSAQYVIGGNSISPSAALGDIGIGTTATYGYINIGTGSTTVQIDYNATYGASFTVGKYGSVMFPMTINSYSATPKTANAVPCYYANGAPVNIQTKIVWGIVPGQSRAGYFTDIGLTNAAVFTSAASYQAIVWPMQSPGDTLAPGVPILSVVKTATSILVYQYYNQNGASYVQDASYNGYAFMLIGY